MSYINNSEQNKSIMNAEQDKLQREEGKEKDNISKEQKLNKGEKEEEEKLSDISIQNGNNFEQKKENEITKNLFESIKSIKNLSKILSNLNEKKKLDLIKYNKN